MPDELPEQTIKRLIKTRTDKRVGKKSIALIADHAEESIRDLTVEADRLADHADRKTIKPEDVRGALK